MAPDLKACFQDLLYNYPAALSQNDKTVIKRAFLNQCNLRA